MSIARIRLVVVDDHALFRRGLVGLLADMAEFEVVGEAANGREALGVIAQAQPDLVLLDVNMPEMDGIGVVQHLRAQKSSPRVLMLTISQNDADLFGAIRAGADGYILKNTEPEDLRRMILRVCAGQQVLSPEVTGAVMQAAARFAGQEQSQLLSERELEVLTCLADGLTTQQISNRLYISENTVKTHIRHILEKLGAANRTEAVSKAMQLGLIEKG